jgi:hypothetical protein
MTDQPTHVSAAVLRVLFKNAQQQADRYPDLHSYRGWLVFEQDRRQGGPLPAWWTDPQERMRRYIEYVNERLKRLQSDAAINRGNAEFMTKIFAPFLRGRS